MYLFFEGQHLNIVKDINLQWLVATLLKDTPDHHPLWIRLGCQSSHGGMFYTLCVRVCVCVCVCSGERDTAWERDGVYMCVL